MAYDLESVSFEKLQHGCKDIGRVRKRHFGLTIIIGALVLFFIFLKLLATSSVIETRRAFQDSLYNSGAAIAAHIPYLRNAAQPGTVVPSPGRDFDVVDAFQNYTRHPYCNISSLDLHEPFAPLCNSRESVLEAMTGGGRAGLDTAFIPRGCDIRWFTISEICEILSRFSQVTIIGDSMMRNLAVAFHVLLRRDLETGGAANWAKHPDGIDCSCFGAVETGKCAFYSAFSSSMVLEQDPQSMWCHADGTANVEFVPQTSYPTDTTEITTRISDVKPKKPHVFVYGHGIWDDLNQLTTHMWIDHIEAAIVEHMPWLREPNALFPRLFITPSAAGGLKPQQFQDTQGNFKLKEFELGIGPYVRTRGMDHMGTYNMTIQNTSHDGTHAGMKANLIKAMGVLNWLNMINTRYYG